MKHYIKLVIIVAMVSLLAFGCSMPLSSNITPTKPPSVKVDTRKPGGSYIHTDNTLLVGQRNRIITFKKNTITIMDNGAESIMLFQFTNMYDREPDGHGVPATQATAIWLEEIVTRYQEKVAFKYLPDEDIVVIGEVTYYKN